MSGAYTRWVFASSGITRRQIHQCCGQPWSRTIGGPSPAVATCHRARSTRTSVWTIPGRGGGDAGKDTGGCLPDRGPARTPHPGRPLSRGDRHLALAAHLELLLLVQVLMRRAVAVVRQRQALAGLALARRRPALEAVPEQVETGRGLLVEPLDAERQVGLDDA